MGLDMYLNRKIIVRSRKEDEKVGYWRKANQIHAWFVENVQGGTDDCDEYPVSYEQLEELLETCKKVKKNSKLVKGRVTNGYTFGPGGQRQPNYEDGKIIKDPTTAENLLPVQSGFFFGGAEYDQWYLEQITQTIKILEKVLKERKGEITYRSSW